MPRCLVLCLYAKCGSILFGVCVSVSLSAWLPACVCVYLCRLSSLECLCVCCVFLSVCVCVHYSMNKVVQEAKLRRGDVERPPAAAARTRPVHTRCEASHFTGAFLSGLYTPKLNIINTFLRGAPRIGREQTGD